MAQKAAESWSRQCGAGWECCAVGAAGAFEP